MPERVVYWKAFADFSKIRKEAAKTEVALKRLRREVAENNAENARLVKTETDLGNETSKASAKISRAKNAESAVNTKTASSSQRVTRARESEINTLDKLRQKYIQLAAAQRAASSVSRRGSPLFGGSNADLQRLTQVINAQKQSTKITTAQVRAANALSRAETSLKIARDAQAGVSGRLYAAEQRLAVARSQVSTSTRRVAQSQLLYNAALADHGEDSARAVSADIERQRALISEQKALRDVRTAQINLENVQRSATRAADDLLRSENNLRIAVDNAAREFRTASGGGNIFTRSLLGIASGFDRMDSAVHRAARTLISIRWPLLAGGVYVFLAAISALTSGLFELASAVAPAIGAIAAIGPVAFAAGAALLSVRAAFGGIGKTLTAYNQAQLKSSSVSKKTTKTALDNADSIKSAQEQLNRARQNVGVTAHQVAEQIADASRQVVDANRNELQAQKDLDQARRDARKNIDDLKNAVIDAALAERGATLDLADAKDNLQQVLADPNATRADRERAQLQVDLAKRAADQAKKSTNDAKKHSRAAATAGVSGNSDVVRARRALADADYAAKKAERDYTDAVKDGARQNKRAAQAVVDAQRQLARANRNSVAAADDAGAAADNYKQRLAQLSPAARKFVKTLISMKHYWTDLKKVAAQNLFPGLTSALKRLVTGLFPTVKKGVAGVSKALGNIANSWSKLLTQTSSKKMFGDLFDASPKLLHIFSNIFKNVFKIFRAGTGPAIDLAIKLSKGIEGWTDRLAKSAKEAEKQGRIAKFFHKTYAVLHQLGQILRNVIGTFHHLGIAADDSGKSLLDSIEKITKKWNDWTGSTEGQAKLEKFFGAVRNNLRTLDAMIGHISLGFFKLGASKSLTPILKGLQDIWNAIKQAIGGSNAGGVFVDLLHSIATAIRTVSEDSSALKVFFSVLNTALHIFNGFMKIPGAAAVISTIFAAFAAYKGLKLIGAISGITRLGRAIGTFNRAARESGGAANLINNRFTSFRDRIASHVPGTVQNQARKDVARLHRYERRLNRRAGAPYEAGLPGTGGGTRRPRPGPGGGVGVRRPSPGPTILPGSGARRPMPGEASTRRARAAARASAAAAGTRGTAPIPTGGRPDARVPIPMGGRPESRASAQRRAQARRSSTRASRARAQSRAMRPPISPASGGGLSTTSTGAVRLTQGQSINLTTGEVRDAQGNVVGRVNPQTGRPLPGSGARAPLPGEGGVRRPMPGPGVPPPRTGFLSRMRGRLGPGDAGFVNPSRLGSGLPTGSRTSRFGRGLGAAAGIGIGVVGSLIGDTINDHRGGAREAVGATLTGASQGLLLGSAFGPVGMAIGAGVGGITALLTQTKVGKKIQKWFKSDALPVLKKIPGEIAKWAKIVVHWITFPFITAIDWVKKNLSPLIDIIKNIFTAGFNFFKGIFENVIKIFKAYFMIIKDIFTGNWGDIWKQIKNIWSGILGYLKTIWNLIVDTAKIAWQTIKYVITESFQLAWKAIKAVWQLIVAWLKTEWNILKALTKTVFDAIKFAITEPFKLAWAALKLGWNTIWGFLKNVWSAAENTVSNLFHNIKTAITTPFSAAWDAIKAGWQTVWGFLKTAWNAAKDTASRLIGGISDAIDSVWNSIKAVFASPVKWVVDHIWNDGIVKFWNFLASKIGLGDLDKVDTSGWPHLSTGGVLPGYEPGKDTVPAMLSKGEGVLRPEVVRALGTDKINHWNSQARRSGKIEHFAGGGIVGGLGNFFGGIGGAFSSIANKLNPMGLWDWVKNKWEDLKGIITDAGSKITNSEWGKAVLKTPITLIDKIPGAIKDKITSYATSLIKTAGQGIGTVGLGGLAPIGAGGGGGSGGHHVTGANNPHSVAWAQKVANFLLAAQEYGVKAAYGGREPNPSQWAALVTLWNHESGWHWNATNPTSGAYGIPQALPPEKMASAGPDWRTNAGTQVSWGLDYIKHRYGNPAAAWNFWENISPTLSADHSHWYSKGGIVQNFNAGGVVKGLNKGASNKGIAALVAQAGLRFPDGAVGWSNGLTKAFAARLKGVDKAREVRNPYALPREEPLWSPDSKATHRLLEWVDDHDPTSYHQLWTNQPVGKDSKWDNEYKRNPLAAVLSYVGGPKMWDNFRKRKDSNIWNNLARQDKKADKKNKVKGKKYTLSATKDRHPDVLKRILGQDHEWKGDLNVVTEAVKREKGFVSALRNTLGMHGKGRNGGLFSNDMQNPIDHAAAHALGISHPADWQHPWSGPVTAVEKALAQQDRSNSLYTEWYKDLNIIAGWGYTNLLDWLLDKGIDEGLVTLRSAVKDKKSAKKLDAAIGAGKVIGGSGSDQDTILKIIAKLGSGSAHHPFGLRDVSSYLNVPDYAVVNLFDAMTKQLATLPKSLTKRFTHDVKLFREGLFYANTGGIVPGDRGQDRDTQPAMLTPGEGVLNRRAMSMLGENNLHRLNAGVRPQMFNAGGVMLSPSFAMAGFGSSIGSVPTVRTNAGGGATHGGPQVVNLNTSIVNPVGENSVYSMTKNLQKQAAIGTIAKLTGGTR